MQGGSITPKLGGSITRNPPIFGIGPAEELLRATLTGYCLSIQSMWEKQIRAYLDRCARDLQLDFDVIVKIQRADWSLLNSIFEQLRGVSLTAFDEYPTLSQMQLLGNVCRHGQGPSLERLICAHPELWPPLPNQHCPPPGSPYLHVRTAETLRVSLHLLKSFAAAINSFWEETEYIYNESIQAKSEQLERVLVVERERRCGRGRPWDPAASG
jgi:hypothetical protein